MSIVLPGQLGGVPGLIIAHGGCSPLWCSLLHTCLPLTLICLVDECPTVTPQPDHHDAIHQARQHQLRNFVATWGERDLVFQDQQSAQQEQWQPGMPPRGTTPCVVHSHSLLDQSECHQEHVDQLDPDE